jgi:hypothetical protein
MVRSLFQPSALAAGAYVAPITHKPASAIATPYAPALCPAGGSCGARRDDDRQQTADQRHQHQQLEERLPWQPEASAVSSLTSPPPIAPSANNPGQNCESP